MSDLPAGLHGGHGEGRELHTAYSFTGSETQKTWNLIGFRNPKTPKPREALMIGKQICFLIKRLGRVEGDSCHLNFMGVGF